MSFFDQVSTGKEIPATILLEQFQVRCQLAVIGMLQTFLNDDQKDVLSLHGVTMHGLDAGNPARSMQLQGLFAHKRSCHVVAFESAMSQEETGLLPRTERLAVYTSHYVIQGDFHMGPDALISDFIASSRAQFVGATNVQIFPLFQLQAAMIQEAPLVYVHRDTVRLHHIV